MREIAKVFVIGALGLVMLFGSSAVSSAAQPKIQRFSECQCTCSYTDAQGRAQQGRFNFFPQPNNTTCAYQAIDIYVPCYDNAGQSHPGISFGSCKFIPGMVPGSPGTRPPAKQ